MLQEGQQRKQKKNNEIEQEIRSEIKENKKHNELNKNKVYSQTNDLNKSQMSLYSDTSTKQKLPQVILKYVAKKAKEGQLRKKENTRQKLVRITCKIAKRQKQKIHVLAICGICQLQIGQNQIQSIANCQHKYCYSCLNQYIRYKINRFQNVQCPNEGCKKILDQQSKCFIKLPLDILKKYKKIKQYEQTLKNSMIRLCPNQKCDGFLYIQQHQQQDCIKQNITCQKCKNIYCSRCFYVQHEGKCDRYHLQFFQNTLNYRQCSRCKNMIQKSSGCNHMTCKCGNQFCYICRKKWTSGHNCSSTNSTIPPNIDNDENCCEICFNCCQQCCTQVCGCCECIFDKIAALITRFCNWSWSIHCFCSQVLCCDVITRILLAIVWFVGILPLLVFAVVGEVLLRVVIGIGYGLVGFPCLLDQNNIDVSCLKVFIGLLLLPFTLIFLVILGIKTMFDRQGRQHLMENLKMPYQAFVDIVLS